MTYAPKSTYIRRNDLIDSSEARQDGQDDDKDMGSSGPVRLEFAQSQVERAIRVLENDATFADSGAVRNLLQRRPSLLELLVDILPLIFDTFDFDDIVVSISRPDEDVERRDPGLYVRVVSPLDVEAALAQLDEFDDEWLEYSFEVRQELCVDIDFR